ncbi:C-type lectin-like [Gigantopelta aegis]|uniref:C-type lectin-like n=1 Tax=Gigantopelta aegis TaxID=1735272 RepID=UPI001B88C24E|nr:C-type lectin-like [Gigantopelta aegis]
MCWMMQYPSFILMLRLAVVLCCVYPTLSDVNRFIWIDNPELSDVAVTDSVIYSGNNVTTVLDCSKECRQHPGCRSFTYNTELTCRLHSVRLAKAGSLPSLGSRHYYDYAGECPVEDGYVLLLHLNLCFKVYHASKAWIRSLDLCRKSGSKLIVLDTEEKHTAVREYIKTNIDESWYWIGLDDRKTEGVFLWQNGNHVSFAKWNPGSPNNDMRKQDCVVLAVSGNWWNDVQCSWKYNYICEHSI